MQLKRKANLESEVLPAGMQLKRKAKLPLMIGLTTKDAVSCNTLTFWKDNNQTAACWKKSDVVVVLNRRNYIMSRLNVFVNFWKPFC